MITPETVPKIAVKVFLLNPETSTRVIVILNMLIRIPDSMGFTPLSIKGTIRYTQHIKVKIRDTKDLTPLNPPITTTDKINTAINK